DRRAHRRTGRRSLPGDRRLPPAAVQIGGRVSSSRPPAAGFRLPAFGFPLPASSRRLPASRFPLPPSGLPPPTSHPQPPASVLCPPRSVPPISPRRRERPVHRHTVAVRGETT